MTLSSTTTKSTFNGDGSTVAFATGFRFLQNSHVSVILRDENVSPVTETTWVEGTHYTLTGAGDASGGTVTVSTSPTDYTPQSGEKVIVKRSAAETQGSAFPAAGAFPSATVEQALDLLTMLVQQHSEEIARALLFAETSSTSGVTVPEPTANRLLGWNAAGTDLENKAAADVALTTVSAFINTLLDDADASTARDTLAACDRPGGSTDNAVIRADGTDGESVQATGVVIDDDDNLHGHGAKVNAQVGTTYTLTASDNGKVVTLNNASAITLTLPQTSTEALAAGFQCVLVQRGAGQVTVAKEGSDTIESKDSNLKLTGQHSIATVVKLVAGSPNTWGLYGDLAA